MSRFWRQKSRYGSDPLFPVGPEGLKMLKNACEDYFEWAESNPLEEAKLISFEGESKLETLPKLRAFTLTGLTLFIDVSLSSWSDWKVGRPDLLPGILWAEQVIREQKFVSAAAGLLNANIITRDLGLAERKEISGPGGGPIETINSEMSAEEAADLYARTREER